MVSLRPKHLKRYKDTAVLLMKYGRSELAKKAGLADLLEGYEHVVGGGDESEKAGDLAEDLEQRGPTFVKLGQMLSTRSDLLPSPYIESLSRLQNNVEPFPFEEVEKIVADELGVKIGRAFRQFEKQPVASASLSQVHRAVLRSGRQVAVKVQRPGVREQIVDDLDAFEDIAGMLERHTDTGRRYEVSRLLDMFRRTLLSELDFRNEAQHLETIRNNLRNFKQITVPQPVHDYTSAKILTMEFVPGRLVVEANGATISAEEQKTLCSHLFRAYLHQVLLDGFFHADPHPGNLLLTPSHQIALLDMGLVVRLTPRLQEHLVKLLLSIAEGRGEEAGEVAIKLGFPGKDFDRASFLEQISHLVTSNQDASLERVKLGRIVLDLNSIAAQNWIRLPEEIAMISKTLLNLEKSLATLDPQFNLNEAIRDRASEIMRKRHKPRFSIGRLYYTLSETNEFVGLLPERLNKILELLADNKLSVDVDAVDEKQLIRGIQKVANRITIGLLLAALIIGASLMMYVDTSLKLWGYPAIAMTFFLLAALGAFGLILQIIFKDRI